ncbi:hypothetical protein GCM10010277_66030 [Streptomyces longisporoflavus]|nr:hypothetical protein GCM10010277_66030 [Streptomyces longisporoflavus]
MSLRSRARCRAAAAFLRSESLVREAWRTRRAVVSAMGNPLLEGRGYWYFETPERRGAGKPQGLPARGSGSLPPFAWSSETFGSYKAKRGRSVCLHNYSDFLLSETGFTRGPLSGGPELADQSAYGERGCQLRRGDVAHRT